MDEKPLFLLAKMNCRENIVIIGPLATGKSSVATKISEYTGILNYPIDRLKWYYRFKNGYDLYTSRTLLRNKGFGEMIEYARMFFGVSELEAILNNFHGIIDLGATDTYFADQQDKIKAKELFDKFPNIFLILPSSNDEESEKILNERLIERYCFNPMKKDKIESYIEKNKEFIRSSFNKEIAKHIIYSKGKSLDRIAGEIVDKCQMKYNEGKNADIQRVC